jgi:hypothetical protein
MNTVMKTPGGIVLTKPQVASRQTVLVAGSTAGVEVGEEIELNFARFAQKNTGPRAVGSVNDIGPDQYEIVIPVEVIDGKQYLLLSSREIKYIYTK